MSIRKAIKNLQSLLMANDGEMPHVAAVRLLAALDTGERFLNPELEREEVGKVEREEVGKLEREEVGKVESGEVGKLEREEVGKLESGEVGKVESGDDQKKKK